VQRAASHWRDDPAAAFAQLDRARALNPLSDEPDLVAGAIASRLGDWARMRQAFAGALRRNPENWYAHLELAIVASLQHRRAAAFAHLARARDLNPGEPTLRILRRRLLAGKLLSPRTVDRIFVARVVDRAR
jgi:tetratricopeptide (TPR) repeat protein